METLQIIIMSLIVGGIISAYIIVNAVKQAVRLILKPFRAPKINLEKLDPIIQKRNKNHTLLVSLSFIFVILFSFITQEKENLNLSRDQNIVAYTNKLTGLSSDEVNFYEPNIKSESSKNTNLQKVIGKEFYVQFAALQEEKFLNTTKKQLEESLKKNVFLFKDDTWYFIVVGPFDKKEDAEEFSKNIGLDNLIKSVNNLGHKVI